MKDQEHHIKKPQKPQVKNQLSTLECKIHKHIHFETIDSTNTWAKVHADRWASQGITLITATQQTAGRGRFKRTWVSPPHVNIYATFCFWLDLQRNDIGNIPQLLALAAAETLDQHGFKSLIKWPNDLLLSGKKVGGILCETIIDQDRRGVICGIGLNVNMTKDDLSIIDRPATSLAVESDQPFDPYLILNDLQQFFTSFMYDFFKKGFGVFFPLFKKRCAFKKGQRVHFHDNQVLIEAEFEAINEDGSVQLKLSNGEKKKFYAGEFLQ